TEPDRLQTHSRHSARCARVFLPVVLAESMMTGSAHLSLRLRSDLPQLALTRGATRVGYPATARATLSLRKPNAPTKFLEARVALQIIHYCVHPFEPERSIIHRFVQPGERLIVVGKTDIDEGDVERAPICSPRPIEHFSEYPPRLLSTSPATEHVAEERLATWAPVHGDSLYFRDRLRPHLLLLVTLRGNQARSVQRWAERSEFFELSERFVTAVVREKGIRNLAKLRSLRPPLNRAGLIAAECYE